MAFDISLVLLAQNGDKEAFAQVYDHFAPELYRVAIYTLGNSHDAEDAVSETFIEAYKGIKNVREPDRIKAWMFKILSIRCKRKIGTYIQGRKDADIEDCAYDLADAQDIEQESVLRHDIKAALETLSREERLIISLATIEGYTAREVSQIMESPQGTVSSKLYRALAKLRELLKESV